MKFIKENSKTILTVVITAIICTTGCVIAGTNYLASQISYTTSKNNKVATAEDALNDLYSIAKAVPTGTILSFSANKEVSGYLPCDGRELSRTDYKNLFEVIGTTYGAGDGSTTFNVPDLRGEFLRGTGTNSHKDGSGSGLEVGTHQSPTINPFLNIHSIAELEVSFINSQVASGEHWNSLYKNADGFLPTTELRRNVRFTNGSTWTDNVTNSVGYASRPANTSVLYIIKY